MLTPYGAAKIVNAELRKRGLSEVRPQMMYNYTYALINQNKKPFIKSSRETGVDEKDLQRWLKSYIEKKLSERTVVDDQTLFDISEAQ